MAQDYIEIYGAREHNLKNIDVKIPRNQLVVITGLSGSGKSSLAFDTIYAEGQRRYIETFSAYARQFLGGMERPDVDKIDGLSPVIAIEQKTTNRNPRSTVGTVTEIYDFLRLLYARASVAVSYNTGEPMVKYSNQQIKELITNQYQDQKIMILAPLVRSRKGHYRELFESIAKRGFVEVRTNGDVKEIERGMKLDRYKTHDIEVVIDKIKVKTDDATNKRLDQSIETALYHGNGVLMVLNIKDNNTRYFSKDLMCSETGISYPLPEPNSFSFNSPKGACPVCNGLGVLKKMDLNKIINPKQSIQQGAIVPFTHLKSLSRVQKQIQQILEKNNESESTVFEQLSDDTQHQILNGAKETVDVQLKFADVSKTYKINFEGVIAFLERLSQDKNNSAAHSINKKYTQNISCPSCDGGRLKKEANYFLLSNQSITQVAQLDLQELYHWANQLPKHLNKKQLAIAQEIIKEIKTRTNFLLEVGLQYLNLNRPTKSLSGGEAQRIRLATQIGSQLVNVLYILDEPSIGLHQRDNYKLIQSLKTLRDLGNSVLVVEHDQDMIEQSDHVIDVGPGAGKRGGEIVWQGKPKEIKKANTLTADYLNNKRQVATPKQRKIKSTKHLVLKGATGNNLKNVTAKIPLNQLVVVTGVSGSGKSTLINETLYRILNQHFFNAEKDPMPYDTLEGIEHIDKVIDVDQSPIGRTPRSNPATYTGLFSEIRTIFSQLPESKIRGYKPGRFSFNVKGGRCETCSGGGLRMIEMNFLPDIYVPCETCQGKRFNRETLEVRYKGKSIADVLEMTVNDAVDFFEPIPKIYQKVKMLQEVGLGYISLGQQSTTISGGEAQRVKLATELSKKQTGKTLYILDEPTTGLHFEDIRVLMNVIQKLVDLGNSVIIIEHNIDVIKLADYIIDLGPEGGKEGGTIVAEGTPDQIINQPKSITATFLKQQAQVIL